MKNAYITIAITIAGTVAGQLLTKKGMMSAGSMPSDKLGAIVFLIKTLLFNPYVFSGLCLAVVAAVSWMATLSKTQLSYAYPFMSLAFPIVLLLSGLIFKEPVTLQRWLGMAVIMFGLIVVAKS